VRIRNYPDANKNDYTESFSINPVEAENGWFINAETWYDIKIGRAIYKHMTRDETGNPEFPDFKPFLPVP
jgi:hypothetical protein